MSQREHTSSAAEPADLGPCGASNNKTKYEST